MQIRFRLAAHSFVLAIATQAMLPSAHAVSGDPEAGKGQVIACGACHGQDGATPIDPSYPVLAGQNEKYLLRQLKMIQSDTRAIALMAGQLNGKTEQDLADMAAYYASLPGKVGQVEGEDEELARAANLYRGGIANKAVAACSACHSPSGKGNAFAGFPAIGGQPAQYVINQLTEYREGRRQTDADFGAMMRGVAEGLTDSEIALLANYLQGLH